MIEKLRPNYPVYLFLGFFIVATALFFLTAGRDALIAVWVNKLFDGQTKDGLFQSSQTADKVIGDFLSTWLFVGLSVLKLGIGFAIATIVLHLRASGRTVHEAYSSAAVEGIEARRMVIEEGIQSIVEGSAVRAVSCGAGNEKTTRWSQAAPALSAPPISSN